jgi:hypothetical protein
VATGMQRGLACGALTGAVCLLGLFDLDLAKRRMIPELLDWFLEQYGAQNCQDILKGDKQNRFKICPDLIENTYLYTKELLLVNGCDMGDRYEGDAE